MSKELYAKLDSEVDAMLTEHTNGTPIKLTLPVLAQRTGISLSTVNRGEYTDIRKRLRNAKPSRPNVATDEDAVEWRRKYYQTQNENAAKRAVDQATIAELKQTIEGLVQKIQVLSLEGAK